MLIAFNIDGIQSLHQDREHVRKENGQVVTILTELLDDLNGQLSAFLNWVHESLQKRLLHVQEELLVDFLGEVGLIVSHFIDVHEGKLSFDLTLIRK
jgi:hypothetical protein